MLDFVTSFRRGSEPGVGDVVAEDALDSGECVAKFDRCRGLVYLEERPEQSCVELGIEDGDADALGGEGVAVGSWECARSACGGGGGAGRR